MNKYAKIAVITNSKNTFNSFIDSVNKEDRPKFHFVNRIESTRDINFCSVIKLYDYYKLNLDTDELIDCIKISIRKCNG